MNHLNQLFYEPSVKILIKLHPYHFPQRFAEPLYVQCKFSINVISKHFSSDF